jgi:hypothetical protein
MDAQDLLNWEAWLAGTLDDADGLDEGLDVQDDKAFQAAADKAAKYGVKLRKSWAKDCSMNAFKQNVQFAYRVHLAGSDQTKKERIKQAVAIAYSMLGRACGIKDSSNKTPSQMIGAAEATEQAFLLQLVQEARETLEFGTLDEGIKERMAAIKDVILGKKSGGRAKAARGMVEKPKREIHAMTDFSKLGKDEKAARCVHAAQQWRNAISNRDHDAAAFWAKVKTNNAC